MKNYYNKIESPFNNPDTISKIINSYCDNYRLYVGLVKEENKNKITGKVNIGDVDEFYLLIFNRWKNIVHRIKLANYLEEPHKSRIDILDDYLQSAEPTTAKEVLEITNGANISDKRLEEVLNAFRWNRLSDYSSWNHIDSSYIDMKLYKRQAVEHRLYINCDSTKTHLIIRKFIEKCSAARSNFYFKFDVAGDRSDTIVIYSDTRHLSLYIDILNSIINENNLQDSLHEPPLLTGKINSYIGYGSEPERTENKELQSFNSKREIHLERCIREQTASFFRSNAQKKVIRRGEQITYRDYIIEDIIAITRKNTLKYLSDDETANARIGLTKREVNSSFFDIVLRNALRNDLDNIIAEYEAGNVNPRDIPFGKSSIRLSSQTIIDTFKHQIKTVCQKSDKYKKALQARIIDTAYLYDIDKDNYAVDLSKCKLLGKGEEDDFSDTSNIHAKKEEYAQDEQPKIKKKYLDYKPMTDEEIEESRKKLGIK